MHHMCAGADPVGADAARHAGRQPLHGDHAAPRNDSGKRGLVGAEKHLAGERVNAVGADERIATHLCPIRELQPHAFSVLAESQAGRSEVDCSRLLAPYRIRQYGEQIGPIHGEVGIPVALDRDGAEIEQLPGLAGTPEPDFLAGRLAGKQFKLVADAQLMKHARAVRSELQSGAHFLQLRRLFIDVDVAAAPEQRERRGEPADPAAGNQNTRRGLSYLTVPAPARAHTPSCAPLPPEQPIAPTTLPSCTSSSPPSEVTKPRKFR